MKFQGHWHNARLTTDPLTTGERVVFVGESRPYLQYGRGGIVRFVIRTGIVVQWDAIDQPNDQVTMLTVSALDLLRKWWPPVRRNFLLYNWDAWVSLWEDCDRLTIGEMRPRTENTWERRIAEKQASREADAKSLADGTMTREDIGRKNVFLSNDRFDVDFDGAKPLK